MIRMTWDWTQNIGQNVVASLSDCQNLDHDETQTLLFWLLSAQTNIFILHFHEISTRVLPPWDISEAVIERQGSSCLSCLLYGGFNWDSQSSFILSQGSSDRGSWSSSSPPSPPPSAATTPSLPIYDGGTCLLSGVTVGPETEQLKTTNKEEKRLAVEGWFRGRGIKLYSVVNKPRDGDG